MRPRTYDGYASYIERHAMKDLGDIRLVKLSVDQVQKMLDAKAKTMQPRSVKALRDILRNALSDAVRWGELERNVAALARPPAAPRTPVAAMTTEDLQSLLKGIAGHRFERIYRLAITMGLRRSELLGLKWDDIDLEKKVLHVRRGLQRSKGSGLGVQDPKSETSRRDLALPESAISP